jgi:hypothetical protein
MSAAGDLMHWSFRPVPQEPTKKAWYQPLHLLPDSVPKQRGPPESASGPRVTARGS